MEIIITNKSEDRINELDFDIKKHILSILNYVPKIDIIGLNSIVIAALPSSLYRKLTEASAAYFQSQNNKPAYIEIYLSRIIPQKLNKTIVKFSESLLLLQLAHVIFHEIGHHKEKTRSHNVKKSASENYAEKYANKLLNKYFKNNSREIYKVLNYFKDLSNDDPSKLEKYNQVKQLLKNQYRFIV